jgi:hypothetical protein
MKTSVIVTTLILALAGTAAHASIVETLECGATKSIPADHDRDPIVKIKVLTAFSAGDSTLRTFDVDHYAASGKIYSRQDQYRDRRFWSTDKADYWSGVSIRVPSLTMVGSVNSKGYLEKQYRAGRLERTTISACREVKEESH